MVKDEDRYLREWVAFHRTQGYSKFYIYDNGSKNPVKNILKREIKAGIVDVTVWNDNKTGRHVRAMNHCLNRKDINTKWLSLTDIDEFIYGESLILSDFLKKNEIYDSVKFTWRGFGSSGYDKRPAGLVIESYTNRGDFDDLPGGKSVVKFGVVRGMKDPHNPRRDIKNVKLFRDKVYINHYVTRSMQDWVEKCRKGGGNGRPRKMETFNQVQKRLNKYTDTNIFKYLEDTKKYLNENSFSSYDI